MELVKTIPDDLLKLVWEYIDRPVLLVNEINSEVVGGNSTAFEFFGLSKATAGISWPGILELLNLPPETDLGYLKFSKREPADRKPYWLKFNFTDTTTSQDKFLVFQFIRAASNSDNICAIMIRDDTNILQATANQNDFVTLTSHQLRTPLTGARWNLEIFKKRYGSALDDKQQHLLDNAYKCVIRMADLVTALLRVARVETGRLNIEPTSVEVRTLLQTGINLLREEAEKKDIKLIVSIHQGLPEIKLDGILIGYVFSILLSNAIKYSPPGSEVTVFLSRKDDLLIVQVSDNGPGIPKSSQRNIFKKFYRAPDMMKAHPDGSGLGLYLCKEIVERTGGGIWFDSQPGKGTTFWFTQPIHNNVT